MSGSASIPVRVAAIRDVTPRVKTFSFERADGGPLPSFSGGSHVVVTMRDGDGAHRNPYSLMGSPAEAGRYQISVRRDDEGRGGSLFMHQRVAEGDELEISPPSNLFPLNVLGRRHILIAGGIGITPFLAQLHELRAMGADYQLHYAFRHEGDAVYGESLAAENGERARFYESSRGDYIRPRELLRDQPLGTHVYVCGPESLIRAVTEAARGLGWPEGHIHAEAFAAPPAGKPFTVVLGRSGREIEVGGTTTVLEALEAAGLEPDCSCRGGACGVCETGVLEGEIEHHDHVLSDEVKAENSRMMICVSRARSDRLVLDL